MAVFKIETEQLNAVRDQMAAQLRYLEQCACDVSEVAETLSSLTSFYELIPILYAKAELISECAYTQKLYTKAIDEIIAIITDCETYLINS